jgi:hypothetical protein
LGILFRKSGNTGARHYWFIIVWWSGRNNKKRLFLRISHAGASAIVERQPKKSWNSPLTS